MGTELTLMPLTRLPGARAGVGLAARLSLAELLCEDVAEARPMLLGLAFAAGGAILFLCAVLLLFGVSTLEMAVARRNIP